jgi:hypothetical protein
MRRLLGCITTYTAGPNGARVITLFVNFDDMGSFLLFIPLTQSQQDP